MLKTIQFSVLAVPHQRNLMRAIIVGTGIVNFIFSYFFCNIFNIENGRLWPKRLQINMIKKKFSTGPVEFPDLVLNFSDNSSMNLHCFS